MSAVPRLRAAALLVRAAAQRVRHDPGALGMWLTARGSRGVVAPLVAAVLGVGARLGDPASRVLLDHAAGGDAGIAVADLRRRGPRARRRAAAALLVAGRSADSLALLDGDGSKPATRTRARAEWSEGRYGAAVDALPDGDALRRQLVGELAVLRTRPQPADRTAPPRRPRPRTGPAVRALHVVTNSRPWTQSGYTARTHAVLTAQRSVGMDASAVTPLGYPATVLRLPRADVEPVDGLLYHRLVPSRWPRDPVARHALHVDMLADLVGRVQPDVLHAHSHFVNATTALEVGARTGLPVVYEVRGLLEETWAFSHGESARDTDRYRLFQEMEEHAVRGADAVLTLGRAMADDLERRTGRTDIRLVPNAVDASAADLPPRHEVRDRLGVDEGTLLVGSVSSLVDYEGFDVLLDAAAAAARGGLDVAVLLVGDGAAAPALRQRAARLAGAVTVHMPGRVPREQVPGHLAALDVFVVPRRDTPVCRLVTPLKPAEAMAARLPLLVSDLPALREFVEDGVEGLLFPAGEVEALASALVKLADGAVRSRMGDAGRDRVLTTRTWAANAATYRTVYSDVLS